MAMVIRDNLGRIIPPDYATFAKIDDRAYRARAGGLKAGEMFTLPKEGEYLGRDDNYGYDAPHADMGAVARNGRSGSANYGRGQRRGPDMPYSQDEVDYKPRNRGPRFG